MLACFTGYEVISRVPVILHTPLMSFSNFVHGIVLVGAMEYLGAIGDQATDNAASLTGSAIEAMKNINNPIYVVLLHTAYDDLRARLERVFIQAGYPVFSTLPRCLRAMRGAMKRGDGRQE